MCQVPEFSVDTLTTTSTPRSFASVSDRIMEISRTLFIVSFVYLVFGTTSGIEPDFQRQMATRQSSNHLRHLLGVGASLQASARRHREVAADLMELAKDFRKLAHESGGHTEDKQAEMEEQPSLMPPLSANLQEDAKKRREVASHLVAFANEYRQLARDVGGHIEEEGEEREEELSFIPSHLSFIVKASSQPTPHLILLSKMITDEQRD